MNSETVKMDKNLKDIIDIYSSYSNRIKNWKGLSKSDLANGYVDSEDSCNYYLRDGYFSCLVIRYSYMIPWLYTNLRFIDATIEDCTSILIDGLLNGLRQRIWRNENNKTSKMTNGAEKVLNQTISTAKLQYIRFNTFKKRDVSKILKVSKEKLDNIEDGSNYVIESENINMFEQIINYYISKQKILEAIVVDNICFGDSSFLAKTLSELPDVYEDYFTNRYEVKDNSSVTTTLNEIKSSNKRRLYKLIEDVVKVVRADINNKRIAYDY